MKKKLNKKTLCLTAAALTLTAGLSVGSAMAYFTTYVTAQGGQELSLGFTEVIPDEEVSDWTKHIKIENTGDYECYVRVKVFAGSQYQEGLVYSDESGKWTPGDDGYYYYSDVIAPGAKSEELLVKISNMNLPKDFNVIVFQNVHLLSWMQREIQVQTGQRKQMLRRLRRWVSNEKEEKILFCKARFPVCGGRTFNSWQYRGKYKSGTDLLQ